jgi:SPP1 family predicted phage head-tail adaptor
MKIAELNKRIDLYEPQMIPDGMGGYELGEPVLKATVWAKFLRPKFWETNSAGGIASAITQGITIRTREIQLDWFIRYNGLKYRVLHIDESDKETLTLTCQAVKKK